MTTVVTLILFGGDRVLFIMDGVFDLDKINRFMGYLLLGECKAQILELKASNPKMFETLADYATNGYWSKFVTGVTDTLDTVYVYYEQVEALEVPSAHRAVERAKAFLR